MRDAEACGALLERRDASKARGLPFVNGTRALASLWIVCQHFLPHSQEGVLVKALWRSTAAVDYFVILSGFVTHWAARGRFAGALDLGACKRWWARRFGRVLLSCWLAMAFSAALLKASGGDVAPGHVARCFLLVESWRDPNRWCPDGQTWTVAALAPCWLLYPLLFHRAFFERRRAALLLSAAGLVALPAAAACLLLSNRVAAGALFRRSPHVALYLWPPSQLPDFALGVVAAELAAARVAEQAPRRTGAGLRADAVALVVAAIVLFAPNPGLRYRLGEEIWFDHGLGPLLALFLYLAARDATAPGAAASKFGALCAAPALRGLGACSFEVYLFQWPVHASFAGLGLNTSAGGEVFVAYALVLYALAGSYEAAVERPYVAWLRATFAPPPEARGLAASPSASSLAGLG